MAKEKTIFLKTKIKRVFLVVCNHFSNSIILTSHNRFHIAVNQCIAIQPEVLHVPMDVTNVLFLHCDQCNIYDHVAYNQRTIQAAMVIPHLAFELMCLAVAVTVMYLWISRGQTNKKKFEIYITHAQKRSLRVSHTHKFVLVTSYADDRTFEYNGISFDIIFE